MTRDDTRGEESGSDEWRSPEETARTRDEALRRLMKMPPKPQEEMKLGTRRRRADHGTRVLEGGLAKSDATNCRNASR